jgi:mono/diheme cytochrome c family protein
MEARNNRMATGILKIKEHTMENHGVKPSAMMVWVVASFIWCGLVAAEEKNPLDPRVPPDQRAEVNTWTSPHPDSPEILAEGKALYEGKGTCVNCHGKSGKGDGPIGQVLKPPARDLTNCEFQEARSDGELFWVIKNGSPGTGMVPLVPAALNESEAWKVIAYMRNFCR